MFNLIKLSTNYIHNEYRFTSTRLKNYENNNETMYQKDLHMGL